MERLKKFRSDNGLRTAIIKIVMDIIVALSVAIIAEIVYFKPNHLFFSVDRVIIISFIVSFCSFHVLFTLKDLYSVVYKRRYIIAGVFLLFVVIMRYSGSSITTYNLYIQPNISSKYDTPILGQARGIRSDEWLVSTQYALSQNVSGDKCSYYSPNARGTRTDMFSAINAPVKDVLLFAKPFDIFFVLFGNDAGLSFWWYGRLVALLLVSFELCMIITRKNKVVSLCGMLIISMSAAMQWWYSTSLVDMVIFGQLALVLIDLFMNTKSWKKKILLAFGMSISAVSYVFVFYPAWQIPFAYVFLAIAIWIVYKNRKIYKVNLRDITILVAAIALVACFGLRYYMLSKDTLNIIMNTSYPGQRFEQGGLSLGNSLSYIYSMFFAYSTTTNPCEYSGMISLFPIPMIVAIVYMIRNKKGKSFLLPLLLVSIIYTIWIITGVGTWMAKISLLYMTESKRMAIPLGLAQIYILVYLVSAFKDDTKLIKNKFTLVISLICTFFILKLAIKTGPIDYISPMKAFIGGMLVFLSIYCILNMQQKEKKRGLMVILSIIAVMTGAYVNPIVKGTSVIYGKPFSIKIQDIVKHDKDAIWISDYTGIVGGNYLLSNGAKVINSTNIYPNETLYDIILGDKKEENREIWNRYAHVAIEVIQQETYIELANLDTVKINLSIKDLKKLNIKYIASFRNNLQDFNNDEVSITKIYEENGCVIYSVN